MAMANALTVQESKKGGALKYTKPVKLKTCCQWLFSVLARFLLGLGQIQKDFGDGVHIYPYST